MSSAAKWRERPGAAFAVPLADGRFGAVRVLRVDPDREMSLVAATQYIGAKPPGISEALLASILRMNSVGCDRATQRVMPDNWPCVWWQHWCEPPPKKFRYLGIVEPAPAEQRMNPQAFSKYWDDWARYILQEWRWQHDRQALVSELELRNGPSCVEAFLEEKARKAEMTLVRLRKQRFFSEWNGFVSASMIRAARKIVQQTIDDLIALGSKPTKKQALPVLRNYIESFNAMDKIDTIQRENICDVFYEIVRVAGLKGCDDLAERWRDF